MRHDVDTNVDAARLGACATGDIAAAGQIG
jgi:hypothetical protein